EAALGRTRNGITTDIAAHSAAAAGGSGAALSLGQRRLCRPDLGRGAASLWRAVAGAVGGDPGAEPVARPPGKPGWRGRAQSPPRPAGFRAARLARRGRDGGGLLYRHAAIPVSVPDRLCAAENLAGAGGGGCCAAVHLAGVRPLSA